ncbi:hypothetical protein KY285_019837 [Solanum tuberosum]|nr:hypothetical protein KY285_019837 [Solanum tuberosum]
MFDTLQKSLIGKCDGGEPIISKDLQVRIKDVALDAEDEVESLMKQLIIDLDYDNECCRAKLDKVSQQVIQVTDSINEELIIKEKINNNCPEADENNVSPRLDDSICENVMEGYNEERENMVERLTKSSGANKLQVVSVVGMAGIGKTTFTKTILFDNSIKRVFRIRGWITVSNKYDLKTLLLVLLHDVIKMKGKNYDEMNIGQLAGHVNQDNTVGEYAATNPKDGLVPMRLLTRDESRYLFYHKAFGNNYSIRGSDIDEFKKVGEEVITNCKGLPLMITAVAGILSSKSKLDEWIKVAQNVSSLVNDDDYQQCLKIVALSYNHLPSLMKACFLHFGVLPKAHVISVKKLIRLWIAEGLVNLKGVEEFEQVAARVLYDLIGKSLVIVDKRSLNGKIKTCRIHQDKLLRSNEIHKQQLESLYAMFDTLQKSLIGECDGGEPIISKDLQVRIKDVALDAEDEVESLMKQLIIECCRAKLDKVSQQVIQVADSVNEELIIKEKINNNCPEAENSASPRLDDSIRENVMEGYNKERENMVERLTKSSGANKLQVVSVVGMAGIDCGNRSRILLTSRDKKVGECAASNPKDGLVLMRPLTQDESRCLFYHKAFGKNYSIRGSDIDEIEKVGEKVITNCKGLPLMIIAVAGILSSKSKLD